MFKKKDTSPEGTVKQSNGFFNWMMEYSKKIISITFVIYVIVNIFILIMTIVVYIQTSMLQSWDTLIMEINSTFRDVIGGYIVKSTVENVSKYSGPVLEKIAELQVEKLHNKNHPSTEEAPIEEEFLPEETVEEETESEMIERDGVFYK